MSAIESSENAPCKIVLADEHVMFREMLRETVAQLPGVEIIGEVGDGSELMETLEALRPDMVILEPSMPNVHGIGSLKEIRDAFPEVRILVLTMCKAKRHISEAFCAGVHGYLLKENTCADLVRAIEKVRRGERYVSDLISSQVMGLLHDRSGGARRLVGPLTPREMEVAQLMVQGKSSGEIAELFSISKTTVSSHRMTIRKKLGAGSEADLAKKLTQFGYMPKPA
ncbi:MAG: response regulator transcription factor [Syntrophobacteraceae bacterium]